MDLIKNSGAFRYSWFDGVEHNSLLYGDSKRKIAYIMNPRAGCSVCFQFYLNSINPQLLKHANDYNSFIHAYREDILQKHIVKKKINDLINENYKFIKFVVNPYQRAVSSFRMIFNCNNKNCKKYDLTFNEFYRNLLNKQNLHLFDHNEISHTRPQYIKYEEKVKPIIYRIDKDKNKTINVNGLNINLNSLISPHHSKRNNETTNQKLHDIPRRDINKYLPKKYNKIYTPLNKILIDKYYKDDILYGPYTINDDF